MASPNRYLSLDVFRGITLALMILVNTPGSWQQVYPLLRHAEWHGCTLTDLVFPFFLFAVGASLSFSLERFQDKSGREALWRVGRRTLLIFAIGLFINAYPPWLTDYSQLRIMGVLQRIAVAYGLAALLVLGAPRRWLPGIGILILLASWGVLYFFGGSNPYSLPGNAALPLDRAILGEGHLYRGFGIPFDPEGFLGSLPSAVTVIIGYLTFMMIRETPADRAPVRLVLYGLALAVAGLVWGLILPINKPLWTGSYVLYTAGLALLLLSVLIYVIDVKGCKKWSVIFSVFGMNPLFLFVLSVLWGKTLRMLIRIPAGDGITISGSAWLYHNIFVPLAGAMNGSLAFALAHVVFFGLIGYVLFRCRFFVRI